MNTKEADYWAGEISDADLDALADAGEYHLEEEGFFERPTQEQLRALQGEGETMIEHRGPGNTTGITIFAMKDATGRTYWGVKLNGENCEICLDTIGEAKAWVGMYIESM